MRIIKALGAVLLSILGVFLIGRAIVEPFVIQHESPAVYRHDWGGPSLIGVLAVHMLPGIISLILFVYFIRKRLKRN